MAVDFSSPLPCPQTARPSGYKGARKAREPTTNPCSATGASGSHLRSFASQAKVGKARANRKCVPEAGTIDGQITPTWARDFSFLRTGLVPAFIVSGTHQTAVSPWHWEPIGNEGPPRRIVSEPHPSSGPLLAVLGVDLGHKNGSE